MEASQRVVYVVAAAAIPSFLMLGMLFYQLKAVDVATQNAEAELVLTKTARARREHAALIVDQEPSPEAALPPSPAAGEP